MIQVNPGDRKQTTRRFAVFYIASIALLAIIFAAVFAANSGSISKAPENSGEPSHLEQERILSSTAPIMSNMQQLQNYDNELKTMLSKNTDPAKLASVREKISDIESEIVKRIDELKLSRNDYKNSENQDIADRLIETYSFALQGRENLKVLNNAMASGKGLTTSQEEVLRLSALSDEKSKKILDLEKKLAAREKESVQPVSGKPGGEELEAALVRVAESGRKLEIVSEQAVSLRKENQRLADRLTEMQRSQSGNAKAESVSATTAGKMEALNADIAFMQVDCNLTRADARQIISNGRQRRDLLSEALRVLNTLKVSENPEIRRKAVTKIAALNAIATNIRE